VSFEFGGGSGGMRRCGWRGAGRGRGVPRNAYIHVLQRECIPVPWECRGEWGEVVES
jgi:hypothetical protein